MSSYFIGDRFSEVIKVKWGHKGETLINRTDVLTKEKETLEISFSTMWEQRRESSETINQTLKNLNLELPTVSTKLLLFKAPQDCGIFAACADWNSNRNYCSILVS